MTNLWAYTCVSAKPNSPLPSVSTPPVTSSEEAEAKFYDDMHALLATAPKAEKPSVLGEFNVCTGQITPPGGECWVRMKSPAATTMASPTSEPAQDIDFC
nr:unnamed protein product [Spirometra erinaceieuropaei]